MNLVIKCTGAKHDVVGLQDVPRGHMGRGGEDCCNEFVDVAVDDIGIDFKLVGSCIFMGKFTHDGNNAAEGAVIEDVEWDDGFCRAGWDNLDLGKCWVGAGLDQGVRQGHVEVVSPPLFFVVVCGFCIELVGCDGLELYEWVIELF